MEIRHLYSFFADIYAFFPFSRFVFVRNCFFFAIFDNAETFVVLATNIKLQSTLRLQQPNNKSPFSCNLIQTNKQPFVCNKKQNSNTLFRMKLNIKQHRPQAAIKQVTLHKPCICDKLLGFNNPAAIIVGLFVDFRH